MKRYITILMLGTAGVLAACGGKEETPKEEVQDTTANVEVHSSDGLKIAYYDQDSLKIHFEYYRERDSVITQKQLAFQNQVQAKTTSLQNYVMNSEEKAQKGLLSQNQLLEIQQNVQRREAELMQFQQSRGTALETETLNELTVIGNKIQEYSKKYCEENQIDILLVNAPGGQLGYIKSSMDVTEAFITFLNQQEEALSSEIDAE